MSNLKFAVVVCGVVAASTAMASGSRFGEPGFPGSPAPTATTWRQTCGQIQTLINRHNHAVLTYLQRSVDDRNLLTVFATLGRRTSERVVKDQRFCLYGEGADPMWVPTRDVSQCFAGYVCNSGNSPGGRGVR